MLATVAVQLANESACPLLKSVDLRTALLSTNPLRSHLHPTVYHQHPLDSPTTINMFHIDSDSTAAFWPCGEDQTAAWSEATSADYDQPAVGFNWGAPGPVTVSTDLLRNMRGYSRFVVTKRLGVRRHI